jgi:hypothetical protein
MRENENTRPAGWYQVGSTDVERWWDGEEWGGETRARSTR